MRLASNDLRLEGSIVGHWIGDRKLENSVGQATLSELGGYLRLGAFVDVMPVSIGPRLSAGVRRLGTRASSPLEGESMSTIPSLEIGFAVQLRIVRHLAIELGVAAGLNLVAEEFTLRGEPVASVQRIRFPADLSLVATWP